MTVVRFPAPYTDTEASVIAQAEAILMARCNRVSDAETLSDPSAAGKLLQIHLAGHDREVFAVVFLDTRHRLIAVEDLFAGTLDGAEVHPREVVRRALHHNASSVIVGHNHPSGNPEPSAADRAVTNRLKAALQLVDTRLLDHFVVTASGGVVSLAARGWV